MRLAAHVPLVLAALLAVSATLGPAIATAQCAT